MTVLVLKTEFFSFYLNVKQPRYVSFQACFVYEEIKHVFTTFVLQFFWW